MGKKKHEENAYTLGERIAAVREAWELSQARFAELVGLGTALGVSRYERNQVTPNVERLARIARQFSIDYTWLAKGEFTQEVMAAALAGIGDALMNGFYDTLVGETGFPQTYHLHVLQKKICPTEEASAAILACARRIAEQQDGAGRIDVANQFEKRYFARRARVLFSIISDMYQWLNGLECDIQRYEKEFHHLLERLEGTEYIEPLKVLIEKRSRYPNRD